MPEPTLRNCRILVVEDEYLLADELESELGQAGAVVLGPVGSIDDTMNLIAAERHIDAAILDVNLRGEMIFQAADLLARRNVPFIFTTGYDASVIPSRFEHVVRCGKPLDMTRIARAIGRAVDARPPLHD